MKPNPFASLNHFTVPLATIRLLEIQGATALVRCRLSATAAPGHSARPSDRVAGQPPYATKATRYVPGGIGGGLAHPQQPKTLRISARRVRKASGIYGFVKSLGGNRFRGRTARSAALAVAEATLGHRSGLRERPRGDRRSCGDGVAWRSRPRQAPIARGASRPPARARRSPSP